MKNLTDFSLTIKGNIFNELIPPFSKKIFKNQIGNLSLGI
jgi:hypothetical protein